MKPDRCGACGGLAFFFGKPYLRCLGTVPLDSMNPCQEWSDQQKAKHQESTFHQRTVMTKARRHVKEVLKRGDPHPYPRQEEALG